MRSQLTSPSRVRIRSLCALALAITIALPIAVAAQPAPAIVTTAADVRALSHDELRAGRVVVLRGVVVFGDPIRHALYVHDSSAGVLIGHVDRPGSFRAGDLVDVRGTAWTSGLAPAVSADSIVAVGRGQLPAPEHPTVARLSSGAVDGQWVEIQGVVRGIEAEDGAAVAELGIDGMVFSIHITDGATMLQTLRINAAIRIRGVCRVEVGARGTPLSARILSPGPYTVDVLDAGTVDPFQLPVRTIQSVSEFRAQKDFGHLVHIQAAVALQRLGSSLFVQDSTGSIYVASTDETVAAPNDVLDVVGFLGSLGGPVIEAAQYRRTGRRAPVVAQAATVADIHAGRYIDELIRIRARVVRVVDDVSLSLRAEDFTFAATAESGGIASLNLGPGSEVRELPASHEIYRQYFAMCCCRKASGSAVILGSMHASMMMNPPRPKYSWRFFRCAGSTTSVRLFV